MGAWASPAGRSTAATAGRRARSRGRTNLRAAPGVDLVARLAAALGTTAPDLLPASPSPDAAAVLREQCRRLFEGLVRAEDEATLSLLAQLLARMAEGQPTDR